MSKATIIVLIAVIAAASAVQMRLSPAFTKGFKLGDYEDPYTTSCSAGELNVTIEGVSGAFCSPPCGSGGTCPAAPSGSADPECVLEVNGASQPTYCALICTPGAGGCPSPATCQAISGVGICTYAQ